MVQDEKGGNISPYILRYHVFVTFIPVDSSGVTARVNNQQMINFGSSFPAKASIFLSTRTVSFG